LTGVLAGDTVALFTACMTSWVDRGMTHLVIDLTDVTSVDEHGAAALSRAAHVLSRRGGSAHVIAKPALVSGPLARSGLDFVAPNGNDHNITMIGVRHVG
jgi:anti-anti-sigma regulatory factor